MTDNVIGAFSEDQTEILAGVSRHQLREWDRRGLLKPSYGVKDPHVPYGRIYSFRDVVSARVLGQLRKFRVPFAHLVEVHRKLSAKSDAPWASTVLYVCGREVVVGEPGTRRRHKLLSGQQVFDIPLKVAISSVREDIAKLNERDATKQGQVEKERFVAQGQYVVSGTRIPVSLIASFAKAGYTPEQIRREYPELTAEDVAAALRFEGIVAAA
ncbi:MAG: DUF433 domain-containing protein [Proteobacteria bacterium]|nr:DUF433 domain-containing protein [Pseudomonadota bacterium]